jgi:uncharacterized alkaline shock family protein YloU
MSTSQTATWPATSSSPAVGPQPPGTAREPSRGETVIAPGVLATVARRAASEVDGVDVVNDSGLLFKRQGATADVGAQDQAAVDLHLAVRWPRPIGDVTAKVRQRVRDQVRILTGYEVTGVNITVDHLPPPSGRRAGRRVE